MTTATTKKDFIVKLTTIQSTLKAPKSQYNSFGKYHYRNCEDILEAVKPLLSENGLVLIVQDDIVQIGDRFYVKATATITDGENTLSNSAFARESLDKKGMDDAQITGATSSYARKYALNGLLLIDDTKDADSTNTHGKEEIKANNSVKNEVKEVKTEEVVNPIVKGELKVYLATGDTYSKKDELKKAGCSWLNDPKGWVLRTNKDLPVIDGITFKAV